MTKDVEQLDQLFARYRLDAKIVNCIEGNTITRYEAEVDPFTFRMENFYALEENIAYLLHTVERPIIFPIYEKAVVAIDVINQIRTTVNLKDVPIPEIAFMKLPLLVGLDLYRKAYMIDLAEIPHLLIAGTTGSGKSVGLRCMIASLIRSRRLMKLMLIDPKCVEFSVFRRYATILNDSVEILEQLQNLVRTVEERYQYLAERGVNSIADLPIEEQMYIVVVIDELADLFTADKNMQPTLLKIVQKSRAAGIHVIAATQRPSVDIITGVIKNNFPGRIAYRVASHEDSRTILGCAGAERLLGHGDLLYKKSADALERIQGPYATNGDIQQILQT